MNSSKRSLNEFHFVDIKLVSEVTSTKNLEEKIKKMVKDFEFE